MPLVSGGPTYHAVTSSQNYAKRKKMDSIAKRQQTVDVPLQAGGACRQCFFFWRARRARAWVLLVLVQNRLAGARARTRAVPPLLGSGPTPHAQPCRDPVPWSPFWGV